jgi:hypothetical protein
MRLASTNRSPRPLISAADRSVAGEHRETADFSAEPDLTFVPGYSNVRRQIDSEMGRGLEPTVGLNHRMQWVRVEKSNGNPLRTNVMQFKGQRYQRATLEWLKANGYDMPPAGDLTPDGGIRNGDCELFYCSAAQAAQNESLAHRAIDSQTTDDATASDLHSAGRAIDRVGGLTTASTERRVEVSPR